MDDVEIVVNARKGVDEQKALKVLAKFLKRDQEKDVDEQLPADVLHQLQQVRDSLEGKEVGPLLLSTTLSSTSLASPSQQQEDDGDAGGGAGAADEHEPEPEPEQPKSEKKHKKKRHKKE